MANLDGSERDEHLVGPRGREAYLDPEFMTSPAARPLRILAEFLEPDHRLRRYEIHNTIVFFGSARILSPEEARSRLASLDSELAGRRGRPRELERARRRAERMVELSRYYADAQELAFRLTRWSKGFRAPRNRFYVCTGGGPGIMEAANRGASEAEGVSLGLNIELPHEQRPNPYQTRELCFHFHYFFMRKFWFVYLAKALVVFPGGYGTLDELFEILTLKQTERTRKPMPILLYGHDYWQEVVDFDALLRWGTIDSEDVALFRVCDDVDTAFAYLTEELERRYVDPRLEEEGNAN